MGIIRIIYHSIISLCAYIQYVYLIAFVHLIICLYNIDFVSRSFSNSLFAPVLYIHESGYNRVSLDAFIPYYLCKPCTSSFSYLHPNHVSQYIPNLLFPTIPYNHVAPYVCIYLLFLFASIPCIIMYLRIYICTHTILPWIRIHPVIFNCIHTILQRMTIQIHLIVCIHMMYHRTSPIIYVHPCKHFFY